MLSYYIDKSEIFGCTVHLTGWAVSDTGTLPEYRVTERHGEEMKFSFRRLDRPDASRSALGDERQRDCGFDVKFDCNLEERYCLHISDGQKEKRLSILPKELIREQSRRYVNFKKMIRLTTPAMAADDIRTLLKRGPVELKKQWRNRYETEENRYARWLEKHGECEPAALSWQPLISIVVPVYKPPREFLKQMIASVRQQSYQNWQLCLADGEGSMEPVLRQAADEDSRIRYQILDENLGIAGNSNAALELATGEYVGLLDHDDILEKHALYEVVKALNEDPDTDMLYSDEDKVSMDLRVYFDAHLKPDFNLDLLRSNNYICHFFVARKELLDELGGFLPDYDGAQDYDLILRCSERARKICHIPRILYHWRTHQFSTSENPESKMYCYTSGKLALEAHLKRMGLNADVSLIGDHLGYYRVKYRVTGKPKISILIPNKDQPDTLKACVDSIREKSTYGNYEIIIIENNSTGTEIFSLYEELKLDPRIRVAVWERDFNYPAINNFGASLAQGEFLLLLNNDTRVITPDWMEELLGTCQRPDVGIVGAKLYYPDDTIQHAGVVMKLAGVCGHVFCGMDRSEPGRFARAVVQQDYSAVTAACMMVKKSVYESAGGMDEAFAVAYNDVDFCLRVRGMGLLVVFTPFAELYHDESKTRGYEDNPEKQKRFTEEKKRLLGRYQEYLEKGDPCYNPNLTLTAPDFSINMEDV
ncbi:glycosyltransferase family 2 protein [Lachnotalea sp. AF33-28]|jgi:GT2 family glycosyltransferase|uniref:glycosyltransferase family 2 protein n=1 Tax=Lachnotalea sp. AF33-28 TaxID=2292046 RepID=UPI000E50D1D7|nr:glycosyltransferase family 2 protein [Lachnotalea sp. AF33-28]RHP32439.1 glycosyltransferase family 2 protein [Lachnotalea sp. AF33-28]